MLLHMRLAHAGAHHVASCGWQNASLFSTEKQSNLRDGCMILDLEQGFTIKRVEQRLPVH